MTLPELLWTPPYRIKNLVSPCGGYRYIHMEKSASNSIRQVLMQDLKWTQDNRVRSDRWTFGVCRNPYDRMVSIFWQALVYHGRHPNLPPEALAFKPFVRWFFTTDEDHPLQYSTMRHPQSEWFSRFGTDHIFKFEDLKASWKKLPFPTVPLVHRNQRTLKAEWPTFYDDDTRDLVYNWTAQDFETFDYER